MVTVVLIAQFFFTAVIGLYFLGMLKSQNSNKSTINRDGQREMEKLRKMKDIALTEPLSEKTRPTRFCEIVGQEEGLKALSAALCSSNPQHVLIYGAPGIGKTAAARVVLAEAKKNPRSPFKKDAPFIEMDATTMRFDERSIADPLIGSVHDPIYQGAGDYGVAGIPQPKAGAVTKAHGGVLFIDEIGELHPVQMNKLLKVLEDRRVMFESAYYSRSDKNVPLHIHSVFENGLPADFRLVGATTHSPEDIPRAIRSRCVEVFFRSLSRTEVESIVLNAARQAGFTLEGGVEKLVSKYAQNGRDAINILQLAGSIAAMENSSVITAQMVEWMVEAGQRAPRGPAKTRFTEGLAKKA